MIIIKVEEKTSIEQALKKYKSKFIKHRIMDELRKRTEYTKKSVEKREELARAKYRNTKRNDNLNQ
jgi:small subunit ribosomal protein S21